MRYFAVRNWDGPTGFQHYKRAEGVPKWIKVYHSVLSDYEFNQMSELNRGRLMRLWLLAALTKNRIPDDPRWVARQIGATSVDLDLYVSRGFLEELYSDSRETLASTEQNRTEKKRAEQTDMNGRYELPEHSLAKLLETLSDRDDKTEATIRRLALRLRLPEAAFGCARDAARGPEVKSPTRVAVSALRDWGK